MSTDEVGACRGSAPDRLLELKAGVDISFNPTSGAIFNS